MTTCADETRLVITEREQKPEQQLEIAMPRTTTPRISSRRADA
jgi:hypothetical protein